MVSLRLYREIPGPSLDVNGKPLDFGTSSNVKPTGGFYAEPVAS